MSLIAIFLAFLVGAAFTVPCCAPSLRAGSAPMPRRTGEALFGASLAFPLGAGVLSMIHFALLPAGAANAWLALLPGFAICGGIGYALRAPHDAQALFPQAEEPALAPFPLRWLLALAAAAALLAVFASFGQILSKSPFGGWDSWAIWTLRGKFLAAGEPFWRNAIDAGLRLSHPEYPLMTPSFLAWGWKLTGGTDTFLPHAAAAAWLISMIGVTASLVGLLRGLTQALLALLVLLSPVIVVTVSASLYADLPLAATLTAAGGALLAALLSSRPVALAALAGCFAAFCAWTKTEGLTHLGVLAVVFLAALFLMPRERRESIAAALSFAAGAAPAVLCLLGLRWFLAPKLPGALGGGDASTAGWLSNAFDFSRTGAILRGCTEVLANMGAFWFHPLLFLLLAIVLLGVHREAIRGRALLAGGAAWLLIAGGYLAIYQLIAEDPYGLIMNSLDRLALHPWAFLVMLVFLALRSPEEWAEVREHRAARKDRKERKASAREKRERKKQPDSLAASSSNGS